jgi:hypothetical protein
VEPRGAYSGNNLLFKHYSFQKHQQKEKEGDMAFAEDKLYLRIFFPNTFINK